MLYSNLLCNICNNICTIWKMWICMPFVLRHMSAQHNEKLIKWNFVVRHDILKWERRKKKCDCIHIYTILLSNIYETFDGAKMWDLFWLNQQIKQYNIRQKKTKHERTIKLKKEFWINDSLCERIPINTPKNYQPYLLRQVNLYLYISGLAVTHSLN